MNLENTSGHDDSFPDSEKAQDAMGHSGGEATLDPENEGDSARPEERRALRHRALPLDAETRRRGHGAGLAGGAIVASKKKRGT